MPCELRVCVSLFVWGMSKSFLGCLIKCGITFPLLLIRLLAAEGGSGCRGGWGQWPDGWKVAENLIRTMWCTGVIILPGSWVKTRGYDSEISICLNACCKNWMFFLLEPLYIYNLSISHLIHFIITSYFIFFFWPQEDSQVILKPISISEHSRKIHKRFPNGHC